MLRPLRPTQDFPRSARLRCKDDYLRLRRRGRKQHTAHFIVEILVEEARPPRLGLTVSRKVGCAIVRNRLKRQLREFFRRQRAALPDGFQVVISARASAAGLSYSCLSRELEPLLVPYRPKDS